MSKHYFGVAYATDEQDWITTDLYEDKARVEALLRDAMYGIEQDTARIIELELPEVNFKKDFPVVSIKVA